MTTKLEIQIADPRIGDEVEQQQDGAITPNSAGKAYTRIVDLPVELIRSILVHLSNDSLANICLTCSTLRSVALESLVGTVEIKYDLSHGLDVGKIEEILDASDIVFYNIRKLSVVPMRGSAFKGPTTKSQWQRHVDKSEMGIGKIDRTGDELIRRLINKLGPFGRLREVSLPHPLKPRLGTFTELLNAHPNLSGLEISLHIPRESPYSILYPAGHKWTNLRSLKFHIPHSYGRTTVDESWFHLLFNLLLSNADNLAEVGIQNLSVQGMFYRFLDAAFQLGIHPGAEKHLPGFMYSPKLSAPALRGVRRVYLTGIWHLDLARDFITTKLFDFRKIHSLFLSDCLYSNKILLDSDGTVQLRGLKTLHLEKCNNWHSLVVAIPQLPPLEHLYINCEVRREIMADGRGVDYRFLNAHRLTMKTLWIEIDAVPTGAAWAVSHRFLGDSGNPIPLTTETWPKLEELAIQVESWKELSRLLSLRVLRNIPAGYMRRGSPQAHKEWIEDVLKLTEEWRYKQQVFMYDKFVGSPADVDHPACMIVDNKEPLKVGERNSEVSVVPIARVVKMFPDCKLIEYEKIHGTRF